MATKKKRKQSRRRGPTLTYPYFEIYADGLGEWRWRVQAKNGRTIADSGEGYVTHSNAVEAVARLNEVDWPLRVEEAEQAPTVATAGATPGSPAADPRSPSPQGAVRG